MTPGQDMTQATQVAGLACRLYLSAFFAGHVVATITPGAALPLRGLFAHSVHVGAPWEEIAVAALLAVIAIWLLLGLYTRVVALVGIVLCTAATLLHGDPIIATDQPLHAHWTVARTVAIVAVAVLAVTGGGLWRLHAGGWRAVRDL